MTKKKQIRKSKEKLAPVKNLGIHPDAIADEPLISDEDPDIIPEEDPYENPTYEIPEPGEGPQFFLKIII